jgi:hypothetical protein
MVNNVEEVFNVLISSFGIVVTGFQTIVHVLFSAKSR